MSDTEPERDPDGRRRLIDELMSGAPADLPSIVIIGDEDIFGVRPLAPAHQRGGG